VLPLENLSGDPDQEYFADGMTEALIGDLAKISALRVISRTSVMQYKRERKPLPEIAQELDVDAVIEGTVMRAGERVRITVQLIDARADAHLWNDRYDRDLRDVLDLQSEVARAVAEQVRAELKPEEQASLAESHRIDPRAYDAFLRARQVTGTSARSRQWGPAVEYLERAVEIDPDFAEAWAQLALVQTVSGFNLRDKGDLPKVRACAQRALELDDRLAAAHNARGWIMRRYDWDSAGARRCFERAMTLSPSDPGVLNSYIWSLFADEKVEEALAVSEQLLRVAPFEFFFRAQRVRHFYCARRYERALEEVARVREIFPDFEVPEASSSYFKLGRFEEAHRALIAWFEREAALEPFRKAAESGWAEDGWHGSIRATVELLAEVEGYSPASLALSHCLIDEWDEALACLERGYRERDPWMDLMRDPLLDPLRSDPRFQDLLRRIGFPKN
jgi:TolB-like protein